jgi:hypothetical protein
MFEYAKNFHGEDYFCFQQDFTQSHKTKRNQEKRLTCIAIVSQLIGLFWLRIYFRQTRLHKTHDFSQIQNPLDKDFGRNVTTTVVKRGERF